MVKRKPCTHSRTHIHQTAALESSTSLCLFISINLSLFCFFCKAFLSSLVKFMLIGG